jgi:hypothetical protein
MKKHFLLLHLHLLDLSRGVQIATKKKRPHDILNYAL